MRVNGEAIYGTSASPFDELPWGRCTQAAEGQNTRLNLLVFSWPGDGRLVVPGLGNEPLSAELAIAPGKPLRVTREGGELSIQVPTSRPDPCVGVVVLRIAGKPIVHRAPRIEAAAPIFVKSLEVSITSGSEALEVRYTLDGSEPSRSSAIASGHVVLDHSATVKARSFQGGKPVSPLASAEFKRVAPSAAAAQGGAMPGLECVIYPGSFERVPDFGKELPATRRIEPAPRLPQGFKKEHEARRYMGFVDVPSSEAWVFTLESDDGAQLWIDGQLVVDNDGLHGALAKSGVAVLEAGPHPIVVGWFNATGGAALDLSWKSGSHASEAVPVSAFSH